MPIWKILLCLLFAFVCYADDLFIQFDGNICRTGNLHAFDLKKVENRNTPLLISAHRDLFLEPVKSSVKSSVIFTYPVNRPSFLRCGQKIDFKNDGIKMSGNIIAINKYFIQSDIIVKRGDSGKIVSESNGTPIGLVSYHNNKNRTFIVRIDNLDSSEFEKISPLQLHADWQIFNTSKEYEYLLFDTLKKSSSISEIKQVLSSHPPPHEKFHQWHSSYLRSKYYESQQNIKKITAQLIFICKGGVPSASLFFKGD